MWGNNNKSKALVTPAWRVDAVIAPFVNGSGISGILDGIVDQRMDFDGQRVGDVVFNTGLIANVLSGSGDKSDGFNVGDRTLYCEK